MEMLGYKGFKYLCKIFVNSTRYVFISENEDGSVIEVEFRDAIFF